MDKDWLVGNPSSREVWSALWIGSVGLLVLGLQPILLGALLSEGRVNFDQLALTATAEILAIGLGTILAAFLVGTGAMRFKGSLFLAATGCLNALSAADLSPAAIIAVRAATGLPEGCLVAFAIELVARSRHPGRLGGYFVSLQTLAQALIAVMLALWIVPAWGARGGFAALAVVAAASLAAASFLPASYAVLPKAPATASAGVWRAGPVTALLSVFFFYMFLGALWAFLEPLGADAGVGANVVGLMVSVSLGAQILGALASTAVEERLPFRPILIAAGAIGVVIATGVAMRPGLPVFWLLAMTTGFIWLSVVPFQIRMAVDADVERGAALLLPAAQLFGAALGPAGASLFVDTRSSAPVAYFAAASAACSIAFVLVNWLTISGARFNQRKGTEP
jgi:MFS transporter, DHA1 family, inner membrane transport protein